MLLQTFHGINGILIGFLCSEPSHGQNSFSIIGILKTSWQLRFSADLLLINQIVEGNGFVAAFRIYVKKALPYLIRYRKNPIKPRYSSLCPGSGCILPS